MLLSRTVFPLRSTSIARCMATKTLNVGDKVPEVIFKARLRNAAMKTENPFKWKDVTTADLFANKRAVIFALPGGISVFIS